MPYIPMITEKSSSYWPSPSHLTFIYHLIRLSVVRTHLLHHLRVSYSYDLVLTQRGAYKYSPP